MKRKKILIIIILLIPIIIYGTKNYLIHKDCHSTPSDLENIMHPTTMDSKNPESTKLKISVSQHIPQIFDSKSPKKLLNSLNNLFKCQLEIASKIEKSTTDENLKKLLNIYVKDLEVSLNKPKDISNITYNHKTELELKVFKTFDISLYKSFIELDKEYDLIWHDDFTSYIKYLLYIYDQSPNTYDTFIPNLESYYDFNSNFYNYNKYF